MINVQNLKDTQLDALREVANIGAGHAATALSQMTSRRIMVNVPSFQFGRLEEMVDRMAAPDALVAAILMGMSGDLSGHTLLLFPESSSTRLAEILLQREAQVDELGELERSALTETANILCGAYLNALSQFLGMKLLPSAPSLVVDLARAVLTTVYSNFSEDTDSVFSITTEFVMNEKEVVEGTFLLLPDVDSLEAILRAIRIS